MAGLASTSRPSMCEKRARKELAVLLLVEPRALDIKKSQSRQARQSKRVERELRDRLVGAGVGLVIKNMNGTIADLEEVDVAGEDARGASFREELNSILDFKRVDIAGRQPNRNFNGDRYRVVGEHEAL